MTSKIEISHRTIIFTVIFLILLWLVYQVKEIIFWVFIAFILMTAFKPWADFFEKRHIPRAISVLIIYIFVIAIASYSLTAILPPLATQTIYLVQGIPDYASKVLPFIKIDGQVISQQIAPFGENIVKVTISFFSNIIAIFTIFVISFYMLMERRYLETHLSNFMGEAAAGQIINVIKNIEEKLGAWVRGQLLLCLSIGLLTYLGLSLIGIPFSLPLSILAGFLEIVPIIGPIISAIPAVLVALTTSPLLALATVALYFVIQQGEANIIVPFVMKRTVGVPPIFTIVALMIGGKLAGIIGVLLSIPVYLLVETAIVEYYRLKEENKKTYGSS